jgi:hypothetical protein
MQAQIISIVFACACLVLPRAASSQPVERTQDLKPFTTLELNGCFDTKLATGASNRIVVSATPEQHDKLRVEQSGDVVSVGSVEGWRESWNLCRGNHIEIVVTASFAKDGPVDLRVSGSGDLDAEVPTVAKLSASVSGSGNLVLRGAARDCELTVSGSGGVSARSLDCAATTKVAVRGSGGATLQGKTQSCGFEIHGSGGVSADDYACESADVAIHGSGSVELAKIADIAVEINGSGDVTYRGEPKLRRMNIHGSGGLRQR